MSRIEKALEKAIEMRKSAQEVSYEETINPEKNVGDLPKFVEGGLLLDINKVDRHVVSITEPYSHATEQYKKLKARIIKSTERDFLNTIMITSSGIGEGKSITAINLAFVMANEIDHTVLLVDTDLRNPSIHRYLGIEPKYGLGDYLKGKATLSDMLIKTGIGKLVFLPAGEPPENPTELLSSDRMKQLVQELKNRYKDRYIIFDSSPLLVTADSLSLGGYMNGIIFVVQEGKTSQKSAIQSVSLMKGWNILGVVFNNVPKSFLNNFHSYYYRYGEMVYGKADRNTGGSANEKS